MNCPNCHEENIESVTCNQCCSTFCEICQPYYDHAGDICQACQERNSIEAVKESSWTAKMRRWFNKPAPIPDKPSLSYHLPWTVKRDGSKWNMVSSDGGKVVASFDDFATADYACNAANNYYDLAMAGAVTYNRIRQGNPLWTGCKEDCELWTKVKSSLKIPDK